MTDLLLQLTVRLANGSRELRKDVRRCFLAGISLTGREMREMFPELVINGGDSNAALRLHFGGFKMI